MKKILLILVVCLPVFAFADDCANAYKAGLDLYKQGKYAEAQVKFIAVAKICGDYSDVWNKLKSCNQKMSEKQSQQAAQIVSLKEEMHQLESDKDKAQSDYNGQSDLLSQTTAKLMTTQKELKDANGTITQLCADTTSLHKEITTLMGRNEYLQTALNECSMDTAENNKGMKNLKSKLKKEEQEKKSLEKQIKALEKEKQEVEKDKEKLNEKIEKLNQELTASKEANDALKKTEKQTKNKK